MADDLFDKIIEDCREFELPAIEPFIQGDPFSDPKILPRLEQIRRRLPDTKLRLYTNGYGMSPKKTDAMLELGIDHLYVSINTLDDKKYRDVMGIPLERTLRNMDYITQPGIRERIANKITFRMTRLGDTTLQEQDDFLRYCKDKSVRSFIVGLFNYKGDINSALPVPSYGCEHVHRLDILASGRVTLCCMDQDGGAWLGGCQQAQRARTLQSPAGRAIPRLSRQRAPQRDRPPAGPATTSGRAFEGSPRCKPCAPARSTAPTSPSIARVAGARLPRAPMAMAWFS